VYPGHQDLSYYLDAQGERHAIKTVADWEVRRGHLLVHMQEVMGPFPAAEWRVPLDVKVVEEVQLDGGIVRRTVTYQSAPDHRVAAYVFVPSIPKGERRAGVLCLHPTGAPGKKIVAGVEGKANRAYAIELGAARVRDDRAGLSDVWRLHDR